MEKQKMNSVLFDSSSSSFSFSFSLAAGTCTDMATLPARKKPRRNYMVVSSSSFSLAEEATCTEIAALPLPLPPLPEHILRTEILPRLPAKSVVRFGSVCKSWKSLFSQASFIKEHLKRTTQNSNDDQLIINKFVHVSGTHRKYYEMDLLSLSNLSETKLFDVQYQSSHEYPVRLVGSINGLVCLFLYMKHEFILWNPAIKRAKKITSPFPYEGSTDLCGFCWDEVENDFKVVAWARNNRFRLYVYSCNSNSWSLQPHMQPDIQLSKNCQLLHSGVPSAIVNGVPYWQYSQRFEVKKPVIKFDVRSKEFRVVPIPDVVAESRQHSFLIVNWKESLSALVSKVFFSRALVDVYCFDERCGGWTKMHNIGPNMDSADRLLGCFKYGGEIVIDRNGNYVCYDHKTNETKGLGNRKGQLLTCFSHKASLVFLEGMKTVRNAAPFMI